MEIRSESIACCVARGNGKIKATSRWTVSPSQRQNILKRRNNFDGACCLLQPCAAGGAHFENVLIMRDSSNNSGVTILKV